MAVIGVLMIGAGVYLVYYAWESHKAQTPVTPVAHATQTLGGLGGAQTGTGAQTTTSSGNPLPTTRVSAT